MRIQIEFENKPLLFQEPDRIITCREPGRLAASFTEVERAVSQGYYVAGFLSYEAGHVFEDVLRPSIRGSFPLMVMGCFKAPVRGFAEGSTVKPGGFQITRLRTNISQAQYCADIERIRQHIAAGDVYQITYCLKLLFDFSGDARALHWTLRHSQPVPYPAFMETDSYQILSLSPEMFLRKKRRQIVTRPMKGSWPLGEGLWRDLVAPLQLHLDRKNRAENVMIADLLRNDLGRVGTKVRVPRLFEVARYRTICQMTSTVAAQVDEGVTFEDLVRALFPSGSVTGAPKVRAMEIIRGIEPEERKVYTGAIGFITPQRDMFFNIPIRTVLLENGRGELGIGGGIVWDSTPEGEWAETMWKARFFMEQAAICSPRIPGNWG